MMTFRTANAGISKVLPQGPRSPSDARGTIQGLEAPKANLARAAAVQGDAAFTDSHGAVMGGGAGQARPAWGAAQVAPGAAQVAAARKFKVISLQTVLSVHATAYKLPPACQGILAATFQRAVAPIMGHEADIFYCLQQWCAEFAMT